MNKDEAKKLSKLLFECRELISMHGGMVMAQTGMVSRWETRVVKEVDDYRSEKGWSPDGFGGERPGEVPRLLDRRAAAMSKHTDRQRQDKTDAERRAQADWPGIDELGRDKRPAAMKAEPPVTHQCGPCADCADAQHQELLDLRGLVAILLTAPFSCDTRQCGSCEGCRAVMARKVVARQATPEVATLLDECVAAYREISRQRDKEIISRLRRLGADFDAIPEQGELDAHL